MSDMSLAEISRWVDRHDRSHDGLVPAKLHDQIVAALREDIAEIKESLHWAMRLIIGLVLTNMVAIIYFLARGL